MNLFLPKTMLRSLILAISIASLAGCMSDRMKVAYKTPIEINGVTVYGAEEEVKDEHEVIGQFDIAFSEIILGSEKENFDIIVAEAKKYGANAVKVKAFKNAPYFTIIPDFKVVGELLRVCRNRSFELRIREIKNQHQSGLITDDEYSTSCMAAIELLK